LTGAFLVGIKYRRYIFCNRHGSPTRVTVSLETWEGMGAKKFGR